MMRKTILSNIKDLPHDMCSAYDIWWWYYGGELFYGIFLLLKFVRREI